MLVGAGRGIGVGVGEGVGVIVAVGVCNTVAAGVPVGTERVHPRPAIASATMLARNHILIPRLHYYCWSSYLRMEVDLTRESLL